MSGGLDPYACDVKFLVNFLAMLFQQGLQHRTVNTIRSAISMTHDRVEGIPIGQHPLVTRVMKGIYNERPPLPRYAATWDVSQVISHIKELGPNSSLSLKQLSTKLVMIMALVQACRASELAALDLKYRVYRPEGVAFSLATLTKKRKAGSPPKHMFFGAFPEDERLCAVACLKHYEGRTKEHRKEGTRLFISYVKPHAPISSQRISKWIKYILEDAGIDTSVFGAHSTRGAASTAAASQGITTEEILKMADWSSDSTFKRFYYRPARDANFARQVLNVTQ